MESQLKKVIDAGKKDKTSISAKFKKAKCPKCGSVLDPELPFWHLWIFETEATGRIKWIECHGCKRSFQLAARIKISVDLFPNIDIEKPSIIWVPKDK